MNIITTIKDDICPCKYTNCINFHKLKHVVLNGSMSVLQSYNYELSVNCRDCCNFKRPNLLITDVEGHNGEKVR